MMFIYDDEIISRHRGKKNNTQKFLTASGA